MGLLPHQVDGLVQATEPFRARRKWVDISLEHAKFVASRINDSKKVRRRGGPDLRHTLQVLTPDTARASGMYAQDITNVQELATEMVVPWAMYTNNWSYDILEPLFQSDRETIFDVLLMREHACMSGLAMLRERWLWGEPSSSADQRALGIPYWVRKASSATTGTFGGGNPTGSGLTGGCGGVSSTTYPTWRNWHFTYAAPTVDDLVKKIKDALWNTDFDPPDKYDRLVFGPDDTALFTTRSVLEPLERLAESRNDNLGADLAKYVNKVVIAGIPIEAVHYLENNDTSDPVYGINFRHFRPFVKTGVDMLRTFKHAPLQRHVRQYHYDTAGNYMMLDRREGGWVGHVL